MYALTVLVLLAPVVMVLVVMVWAVQGKGLSWVKLHHLKPPAPPLGPVPHGAPGGAFGSTGGAGVAGLAANARQPRQAHPATGVNMVAWSLDNQFVLASVKGARSGRE